MIKYEVHVDDNGNKRWYVNGERHRTDGPAIECADGDKFWYLNDNLHRTDGPAVEFADGSKEWYLNGEYVTGEYVTEAQWREQVKPKASCEGRVIEVEGVRYRLVAE